MSLPYENATTGKAATADMQKLIRGFGGTSFGIMEDFSQGKVLVQFEYRERKISIEASFRGYAAAWLRYHPYNPTRMRVTREEHEARALERGEAAVWSMLRDWIKGQLTAIEVGILSFDAAFLGQIMLPSGETVMQRITEQKLLALEKPQ